MIIRRLGEFDKAEEDVLKEDVQRAITTPGTVIMYFYSDVNAKIKSNSLAIDFVKSISTKFLKKNGVRDTVIELKNGSSFWFVCGNGGDES